MNDILGVKSDIKDAGAVLQEALDRISALEAKTATDVNASEDKLLAAIVPEIQSLRVELANGMQQLFNLVKRIDGARVVTTIQLAPERT